jgi:hypothetical protein
MVWKNVEPELWKPQAKGEQVEGVLVNVEPKGSEMSSKYYVETITGIKLVFGSTVLDDRMKSIKVGEIIRITYEGTVDNKRHQPVKIFKVEVNR